MKTRKLLAILLALVMVMGMLPAGVVAEGDTDNNRPIISYQLDGNTLTADLIEIGTWTPSTTNYPNSRVYLASLPYGSTVTSYSFGDYTGLSHLVYGKNETNRKDPEALSDSTNYLTNEGFAGTGLGNKVQYKKTALGKLDNASSTIALIPTNNVQGYGLRIAGIEGEAPLVIIQISTNPSSGGSGPSVAADVSVRLTDGTIVPLQYYDGNVATQFQGKNIYTATVPEGTAIIQAKLSYKGSLNRWDDDWQTWSTEVHAEEWFENVPLNMLPFSSSAFPDVTDDGKYYILACQDANYLWTDIVLIHASDETDPSGGGSGEEPIVDLGTYECADVTLETSTGQFIDDVPIYIITLSKGYSGLLFLQNSNYSRVKLSGSGTIIDNIATNAEITRESDRFNHAKEDYTQTVTGLITEKSGYDYLLFYAEKDDFDWTTFEESHVGVAYVIVEWEQTSGGGSGEEPIVDLGVYECWNIMEETDTGKTIDGLPVYCFTVDYGYTALLFRISGQYDGISAPDSSSGDRIEAYKIEIGHGSDIYSNAQSYYTSKAAGIVSEKSNCEYLLFALETADLEFDENWDPVFTYTPFAYVIVEWEEWEQSSGGGGSASVDKTALAAEIAKVWNGTDYTDNYYKENDRYNGKETSVNGFWADMLPVLAAAQQVYEDPNATQVQVDTAVADLSAAVVKMIPVTQINATALYEAANMTYLYWKSGATDVTVSSTPRGWTEATEDNCTAASWNAYQNALAAVRAELGRLYDNSGAPVPGYNDSTNSDAVANAEAVVDSFNSAVAGLDRKCNESEQQTGALAYDSLRALTGKLFHPSLLRESDYDEESWNDFVDAWNAAMQFLGSHSRPAEGAGKRECQAVKDAYRAFFTASYEGLKSGSGTVRLEVFDRFAIMTEGLDISGYTGKYSVEIPAGGLTLGAALTEALGTGYDLYGVHDAERGIGIYINGVMIYPLDRMMASNTPNISIPMYYESIQLHDGDRVVIAMIKMPSYGNMSGSLIIEKYGDVYKEIRSTGFVKYDEITGTDVPVDVIELVSGEDAELKAVFVYAAEAVYNGAEQPLVGAKVLISTVCSGREEAERSSAEMDTGIVTGIDGRFVLTLDSAVGSGEGWYALNVLATDDYAGLANGPSLIVHVTDPSDLGELKAALKSELDEVYTAYEDGFYTAEQLETISALYETGISGIESAAYSGDAQAACRTACEGITAIQENNEAALSVNLTAVRNLIDKLPTAEDLAAGRLYDIDRPFLDLLFDTDGWYTRMTEYQKGRLTASETALLAALQKAWTDSDQGEDLPELPEYKVRVETRDADTGELLGFPVVTIGEVRYYNGENFSVDDNGWLTLGTSTRSGIDLDSSGIITLPAGSWYRISFILGVRSEDRGDYVPVDRNYGFTTDIDFHYRADKTYEDANVDIYYPIRNYAVVILYFRLADEVSEARDAALKALETAFQNYDRNSYTDTNWQALNDEYLAGREAVSAATTVEAVNTAKEAALAAMAGVPVREEGDYGTVYVTIRNDTYSVENGAPWDGALIENLPVALTADSTMMSCIVKALQSRGYPIIGAENNYISSINGIAEFDGGRQSGWMGTLNDWFTNEGFANFSVANGKLNDGDVISIEYTCAFGADIHGGTEANRDTSLWILELTGGTISPSFDGAVTDYVFNLERGVTETTITFRSNNRAFQARAYLNSYAPAAMNWIRSGDTVKVSGGDVIWVGVGEGAWPAMGTGVPTKYRITIVSPDDASAVEDLISAIGSVTYSNYESKEAAVEMARAAYDALSPEAKENVSNYGALTAAEEAISGYEDVDELKEELAGLPKDLSSAPKSDLQKVKDDYDYLSDEQKELLTVAEQAKVDRVIAALEGIIIEETAIEKLSQDVSAIEGADWSVDQASANGAAALKSYIEEKLAAMSLNGNPTVDTVSVEPAAAGDASDPDGTDGSYSFTVTLSLDGMSQSVTVNDAVIKATEYIAPVDYEPVLKAVEQYLAEKVTDPAVASVGGEWAVFALNRGGVADSSWNYKYIENLKDYVDDCGGRLHDRKYTEYSRVVLALTSMGVDPTQFATDSGTYDLVSPLLDKQNDTEYWAEWQGNNGTAFALLALDSHGYLNNEAGNAARARFIESLKAKQLEGGGWNIDSGAADLDTTAAVVYALAPYYLDATKLDALNCSVSHDELRAMVDSALEYLSGRQNVSGGYGSAEADCWTIIALSSLGRDANSDAAFVKNGHTLLLDLLSYYDEATGAFRHLMSGSVDGMATEQAAYTLVAYDRFMKGQNTLYDMSDVTFRSGLSMAEELIDSITEPVSLTDEDKIEAARAAYDALSDEEKSAVDPAKIAKLEVAERALSDLKVAKAEELIDAIGSPVRLSDENAIGKARNYYNNELSDAERERVGNYDKLTSAESALQKLKSETPQGQTKAVTVTINGVTYEVSEATKKAVEAMQAITDTTDPAEKLPEDFRDLTPEKEKQILDAYSLYKALTPDEKLFATNYDDFYKNVLLKLGESYHYDERTDTDARDNDDDILPWYVKMSVEDDKFTPEELEAIAEILGEDFDINSVLRIGFTDVFTGEQFEPDDLIRITFPMTEEGASRTPVFIFAKEDGSFECIEGRVIDGRLVMDRKEFGQYAAADSSLTWEEIMEHDIREDVRDLSWLWLVGAGAILLILLLILFFWKRRKDEDEQAV